MRDLMERFVLPFSIGCTSQSSVAVIGSHSKKSKSERNSSPTRGLEGEEIKSTIRFLALPKPIISSKIQRLIKSMKTPQSFVYKEEAENMEMEIGFPTEVQHVTHIGCDGPATTTTFKGLDNLKAHELLSFKAA